MTTKTNKPLVAITGASAGIGKCLAYTFADAGYPVLLMARRKEILDSYTDIEEKITAKVDVREIEEIKQAIKLAESKYGKVDLFINNAGIMPLGSYLTQPLSEKYDTIDIDVKGVINGMDSVLSDMVERKHGTIVNISSIAGRYTSIDHAIYNGAKAAVNYITEEARKENAKNNVRFTLIEPGIVQTDLAKHSTDMDALKEYSEKIEAVNGGLDPNFIAEMILKIYELPQEVSIKEVLLTSTKQVG
ncbi:SDR family oxidoreductase [Mesoplasma lactucae]|uniref:NADP-dependent 3-hydroxy acid dehydrogenase YdfG n=1 Tax=Mesoplasma lactucae ATCC 49193 TaxID=81460 RepID=A0A291IQL3_9MOLU|nr:SDR family oxidoreductase [Mesoplasma lactucae]ATG97215.1 oxidoreductase [Mesoplasma lactucae ATCC 49193]ATZ20343.1 oxidoreductase [Mesoplasma lactucae ATCC 49193]MCL8216514.1 putative oxidoreductase [Mesoplasma lactucae ATCC 49193]